MAEMMTRLGGGEIRALARAISIVETGGPDAQDLLAHCRRTLAQGEAPALRIGITGAPGAGKSTLVDQLARLLRAQGRTVGIVAVDATSPYTGGALLGDRIRMHGFAADPGVYIRSMASRGASGGVGAAADAACTVMDAAGRDVILVETVGVGQDEVAVATLVHLVVLVLVPGMGDDVQALKSGVMEVADIFCINKADHPGAERMEAEILATQSLSNTPAAPIIKTTAATGEGVADLLRTIEEAARHPTPRKLIHRQTSPPLPPTSNIHSLDHLGIAVRSLEAASAFYQQLGLCLSPPETIPHEGVRVTMLPLGASRIELLEPLTLDTVIGRFLARRGEGLHHVALRVTGIDALFARLTQRGIRLATDAVRTGAGGHRYFFVHPASTGGVLIELVEPASVELASKEPA
jgi:LAO/AO transport system kinase